MPDNYNQKDENPPLDGENENQDFDKSASSQDGQNSIPVSTPISPEAPPPYTPPPVYRMKYSDHHPEGVAPKPKPPKKKRSKLLILFIVFLIFGIGFFLLITVFGVASMLWSGQMPIIEPSIAVIDIQGVIGEPPLQKIDEMTKQINQYRDDPLIKALVIRINSPGGTVGLSQEIYNSIVNFRIKSGKPVIASMADIAASGGYYVAAAAEEIYANPGTLTGSISVIINLYNAEGLLDKIGLKFDNVKSGKYKDIGSSSRPLTDEERTLLKSTIMDIHDQFLEAILSTREQALIRAMKEQALEKEETSDSDESTSLPLNSEGARKFLDRYADGRILSGRQACLIGLVDKLGGYEDAIKRAAELANISGKPKIVKMRKKAGFLELLAGETRASILGKFGKIPSVEYRLSLP